MTKLNSWKLNLKVIFSYFIMLLKMNFSFKFLKKVKHKESANKEANNDFQKDEQIEAFEEENKDLTAFMSISLNSSDETIAPSTSKQTETVQSKSFSMNLIQKKKVIHKKRNFFRTKFAFKRRSRRLFVSKTAASEKKHLYVVSESDQEENSNKRESNQRRESSKKGVDKKFKVNNFI